MKALCVKPDRTLEVREIEAPAEAAAEHLLVRLEASAINPGDKFFLRQPPPPGMSLNRTDVWGASGAGTVIAAGAGAPAALVGKRVAIYRSLVVTPSTVGCWSEVVQVHARCCAVLPDEVDAADFSGSLVNAFTAYALWQQAKAEGHTGVLVTAGASASGMAMLGVARAHGVPLVSLVSRAASRERLEALGATRVVVATDADFDQQLARETQAAGATAVFDGVSGDLLTRILPHLQPRSTIYGYGFLGGDRPFTAHGRLMMTKSLTVRSFSNVLSPTGRDPQALTAALVELGRLFTMPHFRTQRGRSFRFAEIDDAMTYEARDGSRAVLVGP